MRQCFYFMLLGFCLLSSCRAHEDATQPIEIAIQNTGNPYGYGGNCDSLRSFSNSNFVEVNIKNNKYDTLSLQLYNTNCSGIHYARCGIIDTYKAKGDTMLDSGSRIIYNVKYDTIINIPKGGFYTFLLLTYAQSNNKGEIYRLTLTADSMGKKCYPKLIYKNFDRPIGKGSYPSNNN